MVMLWGLLSVVLLSAAGPRDLAGPADTAIPPASCVRCCLPLADQGEPVAPPTPRNTFLRTRANLSKTHESTSAHCPLPAFGGSSAPVPCALPAPAPFASASPCRRFAQLPLIYVLGVLRL